MDKIINYIKKGRGLGFIFLLAVAVLKTIPIMFEMKSVYADLQPKIMLIADDFLPIKIEKGKVVEPVNVYKRLSLQLGNSNDKNSVLPVVLDTREETSVVPNEKAGLFIMSDMIYFIAEGNIQKYKLRDGLVDKNKFEKGLETTTGFVSLISVIFFISLFCFGGIVKVLFASFIGVLALKIMKKENIYGFKALARMSSLLVALSMLGVNNIYIDFILVPIVVVWFLYKEDLSK